MTDSKNTPPEQFEDLDTLLGSTPSAEEKDAVEASKAGGETPEQARIRQLEEQIASLTASIKSAPEEKTAEQKLIEHNQAVSATREFDRAGESFEEIDDNSIHLHVLATGITVFGRVWHVGQEIRINRDGEAYQSTVDRNGVSWLSDLSPRAQAERWKSVVFGVGPWPFAPYNDELSTEDSKRGTAAPVVRL